MAENEARRLPAPPPGPEPKDIDDLIFRWESDVPTVSDR